jgi:4-amino-4-deoxy-L-arabinose transferase-like glycosyltransferase
MYILTGLWPLLHMPSFEAVTGPKTDDWLVHTVGLLLAVVGAVLVAALRRREIDRLFVGLAIGTALALAGIELVYVVNETISCIYLLDTAIELTFAALLVAGLTSTLRQLRFVHSKGLDECRSPHDRGGSRSSSSGGAEH